MAAASTIIAVIIYVLSFVGMWMVFRKAGRKGWISIIPVANTAVLFLIGWKKIRPFIMSLVLGFGKSEYVGGDKPSEAKGAEE